MKATELKAQDLRLGNIIEWWDESHELVVVTSIYIDDDGVEFVKFRGLNGADNGGALVQSFLGVNLTEDVLRRCGFVKPDGYEDEYTYEKFFANSHSRERLIVQEWEDENGSTGLVIGHQEDIGCQVSQLREIEFLHELQNCFWIISGEELSYNPTAEEK